MYVYVRCQEQAKGMVRILEHIRIAGKELDGQGRDDGQTRAERTPPCDIAQWGAALHALVDQIPYVCWVIVRNRTDQLTVLLHPISVAFVEPRPPRYFTRCMGD